MEKEENFGKGHQVSAFMIKHLKDNVVGELLNLTDTGWLDWCNNEDRQRIFKTYCKYSSTAQMRHIFQHMYRQMPGYRLGEF